MSLDTPAAADLASRLALRNVFGAAPLRFALCDGTELLAGPRPHVATVVFEDRRALEDVARDPEMGFGEAYREGRVRVDGDLVGALEAAFRALEARQAVRPSREGHGLLEARENVHRHYDLGNEFYRMWLDEQLVYSCAYFPSADCSLEEAQLAKLELVCRKLRLRPGQRVVEAGCGWGALALHMARSHGASVTAFNVSEEQLRWARERARREGLAGRVTFVLDDYRSIAGRYDAFVSVGMLEHVGLRDFPALGSVIRRSLAPEGRGLLHFIGRAQAHPLSAWIRRRIFPGAYAPTLSEALQGVLEPCGLPVLDVENLRPHYARTLSHWRARFERASDERAALDPQLVRTWRLYLAGSEAGFRTGSLQLYQVTFAGSTSGGA